MPAVGEMPLEAITPEQIEGWRRSLTGLSNRSRNKLRIQRHGIFQRAQIVWGLGRGCQMSSAELSARGFQAMKIGSLVSRRCGMTKANGTVHRGVTIED